LNYGQDLVAALIFTAIGIVLAANVWKINDRYVALQQRIWGWRDETSVCFVKSYRIAGGVMASIAFGIAIVTLVEWATH